MEYEGIQIAGRMGRQQLERLAGDDGGGYGVVGLELQVVLPVASSSNQTSTSTSISASVNCLLGGCCSTTSR